MKVLHVLPSLSPRWGGPVAVIRGLSRALVDRGVDVTVVATNGRRVGLEATPLPGARVHLFRSDGPLSTWTGFSPELARFLGANAHEFDVYHIHELWHFPGYAASKAALSARKPYIVRTCGELDPWAIRQKRLKKLLYWRLVQHRILRRASVIQAVTEQEATDIARLGLSSVRVIPHGVDTDEFALLPPSQEFKRLYPDLRDKRVLLFLGRIHPKKGVHILVEAFAMIAGRFSQVALVIAGPGDAKYVEQLRERVRKSGLAERVVFPGMLVGRNKLAALSAADLFVLPSYSDVRGVATLEALAAGVPVVISSQCQFPEVEKVGAGRTTATDPGALATTLADMLTLPRMQLKAMGERGRLLAKERFDWSAIARQVIDLYEELTNRSNDAAGLRLKRMNA